MLIFRNDWAWDYVRENAVKTMAIKVVRVYVMESSGLLNKILHYLKKEIQIRGVTVFRAISGYGDSGEHNVSFLDLSMDLPLVIEFFDIEDKVSEAFVHLETLVNQEHIIIFDARANL